MLSRPHNIYWTEHHYKKMFAELLMDWPSEPKTQIVSQPDFKLEEHPQRVQARNTYIYSQEQQYQAFLTDQ